MLTQILLIPGAYNHELREKVMTALESGEKKSQISRMFNISRDTIDCWLKRRDVTLSVKGENYSLDISNN